MPEWIDVEKVDGFPESGRLCTRVGDRPILVFANPEGGYHAILNSCPHAGMPLDNGDLRGNVIVCPFHGYSFDIRDGRNIDAPEHEPPVRTFPVQVEGGTIQIDVS